MRDLHVKLLRALVAAEVATIEHADEDLNEHAAIDAIDAALKEAAKIAKALRKEEHG